MQRQNKNPEPVSAPVAIIGASGFVGRHLTEYLHRRSWGVRAIVRTTTSGRLPDGVDVVAADLMSIDDLATAVRNCAAVINLAGKAHAGSADPELYEEPNIALPLRLAEAATQASVGRFLHLSSIHARLADQDPAYRRPYGRSKIEAEQALAQFAAEHSVPRIISLRPPVIYGPDAHGNVALLDRFARQGFPLPLGAISAKRSYLSIWNLCSAIETALAARESVWEQADGRAFEICDAAQITVADFYRALSSRHGKGVVCPPVPPFLLRAGLAMLGKSAMADGLLEPLTLSNQAFSDLFGWTPAWDHRHGLTACPPVDPTGT